MIRCLENIATFMEALPMDSPSSLWTTISNQFQTFFAKLPCVLPLKVSSAHDFILSYFLTVVWTICLQRSSVLVDLMFHTGL